MGKIPESCHEDRTQLRESFILGLECIDNDDYAGALDYFSAADRTSSLDDTCQSLYASFHGLSRVFNGDSGGVKMCRKAAAGETRDVELFYNLALAEHRLGNRESAWRALSLGLRMDPGHPGLDELRQSMSLRRKRSLIPLLSRDGLINRLLGRIFRGTRWTAG